MELTTYSRVFALPGVPGERVAFSTRTAAAARLPHEVLEELAHGRLAPRELRALRELGLVVGSAAAERREMLSFLDEIGALADTLRAIVVLNLDCNLACRYCFEGSRKDRSAMSGETARQLVSFLRRHRLPRQKAISLGFYGGEPLLSPGRLMETAAGVREMALAEGLAFRFSITTNGTLLTAGLVEQLRPLGLERASVTLDGPRELHDRMRPFKSGRGSYDVILRNLREVGRLVPVQIGGNFTRESWPELPRLLDDLAAAGLGPDVIEEVRFDPVLQEREGVAPPEFQAGCLSTSEPWLAEATVALRAGLIARGYRPPRITPALCMVDLPHQLVVGVDGGLWKCPGLIGRPEFSAGDLAGGLRDYRGSHRLDLWKSDECLGCPYLPLCFGGCRYLKLLRDGDLDGVDCRKPFFEASLERLVLQDLGLSAG